MALFSFDLFYLLVDILISTFIQKKSAKLLEFFIQYFYKLAVKNLQNLTYLDKILRNMGNLQFNELMHLDHLLCL